VPTVGKTLNNRMSNAGKIRGPIRMLSTSVEYAPLSQ